MRFLLLLAALSLCPAVSQAASFSTPLSDLVGVLDFDPFFEGRAATVDFGQRFATIESVSIEIDAHVIAQQFDDCGFQGAPQPCVRQVRLLGFNLQMDIEDATPPRLIFTHVAFSDDRFALEANGVGTGVFQTPFGWDFLLDGEGSLDLFWDNILFLPERILRDFEPPSGEIFGARLIIEGTPIPEPSTAMLLGVGMLLLSGTQRMNRRAKGPVVGSTPSSLRANARVKRDRSNPRTRPIHLFLLIVLVLPGASHAATFSAPIPGLVGVIDFEPHVSGREASFDFGQQFAEIERVSIEIEARVVAEQFDACGTTSNPQPCVRRVNLLGFFTLVDEEDKPFLGSISTALSVSDDPHATEATGTGIGEFTDPFDLNPFGWDILLDGEGSVTPFWDALFPAPGLVIQNFEEGSGEILGARLIIEGTPIPEPSTAMLLGVGMLLLSGTKRLNRREKGCRQSARTPGRAEFCQGAVFVAFSFSPF